MQPSQDHIPAAKPNRRWLRIIALSVVAVILIGVIHFVLAVRKVVGRALCAEHLYQIRMAIDRYADAHHGVYPDSLATLILDGGLTADSLACDSHGDTPANGPTTRAVLADLERPHHSSFIYLGNGLTTATSTADVVLAYELPDADGRSNVLMGDGHVESLMKPETERLIRAVAATTRPVVFKLR